MSRYLYTSYIDCIVSNNILHSVTIALAIP